LDKESKDYEIGREREYEINEKLKKTKKIGQQDNGPTTTKNDNDDELVKGF